MPIIKDDFGIQLKYPARDCKICKRYPCMQNFEIFKCNFAKYGCKEYKEKEDKTINDSDNMKNT